MGHFFEKGFSVSEPAWHGLAEVLGEYPGRDEAMVKAGHNFEVLSESLWMTNDREVEGWKALVRNDTAKILNVVPDSYVPVQNSVLWDVVDALVGQDNVQYETAGVLKGGAVLWTLARLDEPTQIAGDPSPIYPYCCVSTSHDGSAALKAQALSIRVICWNTYMAGLAESGRSGREYMFKHTKTVMERVADAKMALAGVRTHHQAFMDLAEELATIGFSEDQRELFIEGLIPSPPGILISDRVRDNIDEARGNLRQLWNTPSIPEAHQETAYGALCAGIEYLEHVRPYRSTDTYLGRSILKPDMAKERVVELIREIVVI